MQIKDDLVEIQGNDGLVRRGIITTPISENHSETGIILLPAGLKYRCGPQRFYVFIARYLAERGYPVLRFDPVGIGESDGELPVVPHAEIFRSIEQGRFVDDAILASEWMKKCFGIKKVIVGGICGAAITSQLAAVEKIGVINGIISINTAVSNAGTSTANTMVLGNAQVKKNSRAYLKKILSLHAWSRIFKGTSDYKSILKTLYTLVINRLTYRTKKIIIEPHPNENPKFIKSFQLSEQLGIRHFLLFSGNDNRWSEFQDIILNRYLDSCMESNNYKIDVIPDANHELHLKEWQLQAMNKIYDWLQDSFESSCQNTSKI